MALPEKVVKRDRTVEPFDRRKLAISIHHALVQARYRDHHTVHALHHEILSALERRRKKRIAIEEIRDAVRKVLLGHGMKKAAKAYDFVFLHVRKPKLGKVIKRDGSVESFDPAKLFKSICKAAHRAGMKDVHRCEAVTRQVIRELGRRYKGKPVSSQEIKYVTARVLEKNRLKSVARHYLIYRYF